MFHFKWYKVWLVPWKVFHFKWYKVCLVSWKVQDQYGIKSSKLTVQNKLLTSFKHANCWFATLDGCTHPRLTETYFHTLSRSIRHSNSTHHIKILHKSNSILFFYHRKEFQRQCKTSVKSRSAPRNFTMNKNCRGEATKDFNKRHLRIDILIRSLEDIQSSPVRTQEVL